jgi:polar amino acid transport system substrate-binding protein
MGKVLTAQRVLAALLTLAAPPAIVGAEAPVKILVVDAVSSSSIISEALDAIVERLGYAPTYEVVPFARALHIAKERNDIILTPLLRTEARERQYRWLIPLFEDDLVLISTGSHSPEIDPAKIVGVPRATTMQETAENLGFRTIDQVSDDIQNARKLLGGRIDLWLTARSEAVKAIQFIGASPGQFHISDPLKTLTVYIASPLGLEQREADRWEAAGHALRADGTFDRIFNRSALLGAHSLNR